MYNLNSHQNKMNQIRQCPLLASSYLLKSAAKTSKPLRSKSCARPISTDITQLSWVYNKMTFPTSALLMTSMTDVMAICWKKMKTPALYNDSMQIWRISNLRPSPFFLLESRFFMRSLSKSSRTKITSFPELSLHKTTTQLQQQQQQQQQQSIKSNDLILQHYSAL